MGELAGYPEEELIGGVGMDGTLGGEATNDLARNAATWSSDPI